MSRLNPEKRKLGQVVLDFVNAKSTDDAVYTVIEDLKDTFRQFSPDIEQVKKEFPALRPFEDLDSPKRKLFELLLELKRLLANTSSLSLEDPEIEFIKYDYHGRIFIKLYSYDWSNDPTEPTICTEEFSCLLEQLKGELFDRFIDLKWLVDPEDVRAFCLSGEHKDLDTIEQIGKKISDLKPSISENDFEYISNLVLNYEPAIDCSNVLGDIQTNLRQAITMIIEGFDLGNIQPVQDCLVRYNRMPKKGLDIKGNSFFEVTPFSIGNEGVGRETSSGDISLKLIAENMQSTVLKIISYCLIEFLREEGSSDYLGQCENEECRKYFIATRLNRQKFCSKKCRQDYNNRERIKSGEHARYKRERKKEGKATASYYG